MIFYENLLYLAVFLGAIMEVCKICHGPLATSSTVCLTLKGSKTINAASEERGQDILCIPGDVVHTDCRKFLTDKRRILVAKRRIANCYSDTSEPPKLRSHSSFDFRDHCLFCGFPAKINERKRGNDAFSVRTFEFQKTIGKICEERNDSWSREVKGRLGVINDLHAADALYHQTCSVNFRTRKNIPSTFSPTPAKQKKECTSGRPVELIQQKAFMKITDYLEANDDEQITIVDLVKKMEEFCEIPYSVVYMKQKLRQKYDKDIVFTDVNGKLNVVTFCYTAKSILHDFYMQQKKDPESDKFALITAASKIIRSDIKCMSISKQSYPSPTEVGSMNFHTNFLPLSLKIFLDSIFIEKNPNLKIAAIGQAMIQAARPRVIISPLQISLGVVLHQHFASRFLIDTLHNLGFCTSYSEIKKFQSSAAVVQGNSLQVDVGEESCLQFVADNVDHNACTIDGLNTFHGMGIMAAITPVVKKDFQVPRRDVSKEEVLNIGTIDVSLYQQKTKTEKIPFAKLRILEAKNKFWELDFMSSIIWPLRYPKPAWSGFLQMFSSGTFPGQSSSVFFPMIDLDPSNMSCIYTTLKFVCREASRYNKTPVITFDQPLYWKALLITRNERESDLNRIVIRLGGFHLQMSFLGAIGHIMGGSGLQELLECVYAPNAVVHMLSGKAVSRAVRGHFLVESTLYALILSEIYGIQIPNEENGGEKNPNDESRELQPDDTDLDVENHSAENSSDCNIAQKDSGDADEDLSGRDDSFHMWHPDLQIICAMYDDICNENLSADEACKNDVFKGIKDKMSGFMRDLSSNRTATLWFEYLNMVSLLHTFIKAERTGDWFLHLQTVQKMLPYLAAAGHNLYVKSAYIYLTEMCELEETHPDVHSLFAAGYHVVRRSNKYCAGLSTDLSIEQILMRSLKTTGGLTRGRGMSEYQRALWLLSSPICAEITQSLQILTEVNYSTGEQHKETSKSRQERDHKDMLVLVNRIAERNPFDRNVDQLRSIETGMTAEKEVNVDRCNEIGSKVISSLSGNDATTFSFKKKNKAITMHTKQALTIDNETAQVDPQLLFQRITTVARDAFPEMSELFKFELSSHPSSLFDNSGMPREANKSTLADAIWTSGECGIDALPVDTKYVLDGGSLLHKLPWTSKLTFGDISKMYSRYVASKFSNCMVVFDGYSHGPTIKDVAHIRRSKGLTGRDVFFNENTPFRSKKEVFLSNPSNKQKFIELLQNDLQKSGCCTINADCDADLLIVQTTLSQGKENNVALIGEDTDLLVLLLHHMDLAESKEVYFLSDRVNKTGKIWDIKKTKIHLTDEVCECILFLHAFTGCDTTSRIYGLSKGQMLKKVKVNSAYYKEVSSHFLTNSPIPSKEMLASQGEDVIAGLFGAQPCEGLDILRFRKFVTKTSRVQKQVQVCSLPPSYAAAIYHIYRVYHQVQQWIGNNLEPKDWGWKLENGILVPTKTHLPPAPEELLKIIRCNCKSNCESKRCNCKRHGIVCSMSCGECRGTSCSNSIDGDINFDDE